MPFSEERDFPLDLLQRIKERYITIYGPYYPLEALARLHSLKKTLKSKGIKNTFLTQDHPTSFFPFPLPLKAKHKNIKRSEYCLENSDLNILIFLFIGDNTGVTYELLYCIDKSLPYILIVEEIKIKRKTIIACSSLIEEHIDRIGNKIIRVDRDNDEDLQIAAFSRTLDFFI